MSNPDSNINAEEEPLSNPESNINVDEEPLHLFTPPRLRHPEYWQCIKLISKSSLPVDMISKNAINAYCTKCKLIIRYDAKKHSRGVSRHMLAFHQDVIDKYFEQSNAKTKRTGSKLTEHFHKKSKHRKKRATLTWYTFGGYWQGGQLVVCVLSASQRIAVYKRSLILHQV